ncbi:MAG TPA: hypothetical protein VGG65_06190, partial [Thermoanaerobaculia bacterium]
MTLKRSLLALAAVCALLHEPAFAQNAKAALPTVSGGARRTVAAPAAPSSDTVLYSQLDNDTGLVSVSQDFETALDQFDSQAADDFVVPPGVSWQINSVVTNGQYFNGAGPAAAVNLTISDDNAGLPGAAACSYPLQTPADSTGNFTFTLPAP